MAPADFVHTASERNFTRGYENRHWPPLFSWALVKTCKVYLYSNQNQSCRAKIYKYINCYTGSWLTLIILGLFAEKLIMCRPPLTFPDPGTMYLSYHLP